MRPWMRTTLSVLWGLAKVTVIVGAVGLMVVTGVLAFCGVILKALDEC